MVLLLAAFLGGSSFDGSRQMANEDPGFNFVAMLAAGTAASLSTDLAVSKKFFDRELRWVVCGHCSSRGHEAIAHCAVDQVPTGMVPQIRPMYQVWGKLPPNCRSSF